MLLFGVLICSKISDFIGLLIAFAPSFLYSMRFLCVQMWTVCNRDANFCIGDVLQGGDMNADGQTLSNANASWMQASRSQDEIACEAIVSVQSALLPPRTGPVQEVLVQVSEVARWRICHVRMIENDITSCVRYSMNVQSMNRRDEYYLIAPEERMLYFYTGKIEVPFFQGLPLVLDQTNCAYVDFEMQQTGLKCEDLMTQELILRVDVPWRTTASKLRSTGGGKPKLRR